MANLIEYIQSQVYENSTEDISGSIMQQVLTRMASDEGVVNVHTISGQTPFADYNNAQAARDAVPAGFKKLGLIITYKLSSGWYIDEFIGSATSGWSTASNWKCLGPISVSQNASTGKTTITIGSESFDVATQPVSVSQNTLTIGGEAKGQLAGHLIENEEWIWVVADNGNGILLGFHKTDGSPYFGYGCPPQVVDYITSKLGNYNAEDYDAIKTFLGSLVEGDSLSELLNGKVDKVDGKSLIDGNYADGIQYIDNPEFIEAKTDKNGNPLFSVGKKDGKQKFYTPLAILGYVFSVTSNPEWKIAVIDDNYNVAIGLKNNGKFYANLDGIPQDVEIAIEGIKNQFGERLLTATEFESIIPQEQQSYLIVEEGANGQILKQFYGSKEKKGRQEYDVENTIVRAFLHSFIYNNNDYTYTLITSYYNLPYSTERSYPLPAYVSINKGDVDSSIVSKTIIKTYDINNVLIRIDEFDGLKSLIPIYNLIPGNTYKYVIQYQDLQGLTYNITHGVIYMTGQMRMIYVDGVYNFRDIGGWPTLNGYTLQYDKLFRSGELSSPRPSQGSITEAGIHELIDNLKINVELDFGDYDHSPVESDLEFYHGSDYQILAYDRGLNPNSPDFTGTQYKNCFNLIVDKLRAGKRILFHCSVGCDRTGTFAFILEALLGVCESDLSKDYELSSMRDLRRRNVNEGEPYGYPSMINFVKTTYSGDTLNDKIENMMLSFGVSQTQIDDFRNFMLN